VTRVRRIPLLVLVVTVAAVIAVILLENNADANRRTEVRVGSLNQSLTDLEAAPLRADPTVGGTSTPAAVRMEIQHDEGALTRGLLGSTRVKASAASLATARLELQSIDATVAEIYRIASRPGGVNDDKRVRALEISF